MSVLVVLLSRERETHPNVKVSLDGQVAITDAKRPMARARQSKNMWIAANEEEQGSVRRS